MLVAMHDDIENTSILLQINRSLLQQQEDVFEIKDDGILVKYDY